VAQINGASESLKKCKIEHVLVKYVEKDGEVNDAFLVVMNKHFHDAKTAILADGYSILKTKNVRHYEKIALSHEHYQPTFDCVCRGCSKTFKHVDPNAKWCSKECKAAWRKAKKTAKAA
ncbi:MAG: hypothetical protein J6S67_26595, partial [Methanobrevibacter sp.]|nr:hypothetical protein [Methanobrevibacter sp.]